MRRHSRPYKAKKQYRKEGKEMTSKPFEVEVRSLFNGVELVTRYKVKSSNRKCSKCQKYEYGRVFKIVGISEVFDITDYEPFSPQQEQRKNQGKILCLDCLN